MTSPLGESVVARFARGSCRRDAGGGDANLLAGAHELGGRGDHRDDVVIVEPVERDGKLLGMEIASEGLAQQSESLIEFGEECHDS